MSTEWHPPGIPLQVRTHYYYSNAVCFGWRRMTTLVCPWVGVIRMCFEVRTHCFDSPVVYSIGWWFERGWVVCDGGCGVGWWVVPRFFWWCPDFLNSSRFFVQIFCFRFFVQIFYNMLRFFVQIFWSRFFIQIFFMVPKILGVNHRQVEQWV